MARAPYTVGSGDESRRESNGDKTAAMFGLVALVRHLLAVAALRTECVALTGGEEQPAQKSDRKMTMNSALDAALAAAGEALDSADMLAWGGGGGEAPPAVAEEPEPEAGTAAVDADAALDAALQESQDVLSMHTPHDSGIW